MSDRDHHISLADAIKLTHRWQDAQPNATRAWKFSRGIVDEMLKQSDCAGVRIYMAQKEKGEVTLVVVGTDAAGNDLTSGTIAEEALPCPFTCPKDSPLQPST